MIWLCQSFPMYMYNKTSHCTLSKNHTVRPKYIQILFVYHTSKKLKNRGSFLLHIFKNIHIELWIKNSFFVEVQVIYNTVLVSGVQWSDSITHILFYTLFSIMCYYKILNLVPVLYSKSLLFIFYIVVCIC